MELVGGEEVAGAQNELRSEKVRQVYGPTFGLDDTDSLRAGQRPAGLSQNPTKWWVNRLNGAQIGCGADYYLRPRFPEPTDGCIEEFYRTTVRHHVGHVVCPDDDDDDVGSVVQGPVNLILELLRLCAHGCNRAQHDRSPVVLGYQ